MILLMSAPSLRSNKASLQGVVLSHAFQNATPVIGQPNGVFGLGRRAGTGFSVIYRWNRLYGDTATEFKIKLNQWVRIIKML